MREELNECRARNSHHSKQKAMLSLLTLQDRRSHWGNTLHRDLFFNLSSG
ncbi:hypothetical protein CKA32_000543 [Geitlerinema sp. FC II]|nr:hypothetical protein CKA32_000543 [Geitlerinema sp. FC II]